MSWFAARRSYRQEGHLGFLLMMGSEGKPWRFQFSSSFNPFQYKAALLPVIAAPNWLSLWDSLVKSRPGFSRKKPGTIWNPSAVAACQRWSLSPWLWTSSLGRRTGKTIGCVVWQLPDMSCTWKRIHWTKPAPCGLRASMSPQNLSGQWLSGSDGIFATCWPLQ